MQRLQSQLVFLVLVSCACARVTSGPLNPPLHVGTTSDSLDAPPAPGVWQPGKPAADADVGFEWLATEVNNNCDGQPTPPAQITTEHDFVRALCQQSSVDWTRYRLLIYLGYDIYAERRLVLTHVKETTDELLLFIEARGACRAEYGWESGGYTAALVPRSSKKPLFIKRATSAPPCPRPESYAY